MQWSNVHLMEVFVGSVYFLLYFSFCLYNSPLVTSNEHNLHIKKAQIRHLWCTRVSMSFGGAKCLWQTKNCTFILRHIEILPLRWQRCCEAALTINVGEQFCYLRCVREVLQNYCKKGKCPFCFVKPSDCKNCSRPGLYKSSTRYWH